MLYLYNFNSQFKNCEPHHFVLSTCQRNLILTTEKIQDINQHYECYINEKAYTYLLQVICGLKSRLIAENEIVSQFKTATLTYLDKELKDKELSIAIQKAQQDQKFIRSEYLMGISQKTYAALTKKLLNSNLKKDSNILILGSGMLAEDLVNQLKKDCHLFISGRNVETVTTLENKHFIKSIEWNDLSAYETFDIIINTVGTNEHILQNSFFDKWKFKDRAFIDLGDPEVKLDINHKKNNYFNLESIYKLGAIALDDKNKKIFEANDKIFEISKKRIQWLEEKKRKRLSHESGSHRDKREPTCSISSALS